MANGNNGATLGKTKVTKEQIVAAIKGSAGIKVVVADRLKVTRQSLENYIKRYPDLAEMIVQEREQALDMAELLVLTNIQIQRSRQQASGEPVDSSDAWKLLDKMGWKRGYAFAGNPSSIDAAREASAAGNKVTIREVVIELPQDDVAPPDQKTPVLGEEFLVVDVDDVKDEQEDVQE